MPTLPLRSTHSPFAYNFITILLDTAWISCRWGKEQCPICVGNMVKNGRFVLNVCPFLTISRSLYATLYVSNSTCLVTSRLHHVSSALRSNRRKAGSYVVCGYRDIDWTVRQAKHLGTCTCSRHRLNDIDSIRARTTCLLYTSPSPRDS